MQIGGSSRIADVKRFYLLLDRLEQAGKSTPLHTANPRVSWPLRGVYFFFEPGEFRSDTGEGRRVVRVGTHALREGSSTTLGGRLSQHRGTTWSGGGNHRGSIFRLLVGSALAARDPSLAVDSWGRGGSASREVRDAELLLEQRVSEYMRQLTVLTLEVPDEPGPTSLRGYVERNAIAILSNYSANSLDPPSPAWLGHHCRRERVRLSGLWNNNHVDEAYDPGFLKTMAHLIEKRS